MSDLSSFADGRVRGSGLPAWLRTALPLLLILVLALGLRVLHLDRLSLWNDELFSRYYGELFGMSFLWGPGLRLEPTPPLYYTILRGWIALFGDSAAALRFLSVLAGCAAVPLAYALAREFGPRRQALVAALLVALWPIGIYFSQEARVYALMVLPAAAVLLGLARFLRDPGRLGGLAWYGVGGIFGVYCHPTFPILLAVCNAVALGWLLAGGKEGRWRAVALWLGVNALVALASLPVALAILGGGNQGATEWIPPLRARDVAVALSALVSGVVTDPRLVGTPLAGALLLALAASLWARPPGRRELAVLVGVPLAFLLLVIAISLARPILLPRVLCWMAVPLCVALAHGLTAPSRMRPVLGAVTAVTLVVGLGWQVGFSDNVKEPWRDVLAEVGTDIERAELVVLGPSTDPVVLAYYAPQVEGARMWDNGSPSNIENTWMRDRLRVAPIGLQDILQAIRAGRSVWLVSNYMDQRAVEGLLGQAPPPVRRIERFCTKYKCVTVLAWAGGGGTRTP